MQARSGATCSGAHAHACDQARKTSRRWPPASKVTASQLCGRETKESRQQCTLAVPVARSSASGGGAPFDPRGTCQQGATQRDLHPTTSVNRRQALCVWLRAESRPIRQANAQKAGGREAEAKFGDGESWSATTATWSSAHHHCSVWTQSFEINITAVRHVAKWTARRHRRRESQIHAGCSRHEALMSAWLSLATQPQQAGPRAHLTGASLGFGFRVAATLKSLAPARVVSR